MTADEVEEKFLSLAAPVLGNNKAVAIKDEVQSLDACDSLDGLLAALKDRVPFPLTGKG